jgi:hypothetical protein
MASYEVRLLLRLVVLFPAFINRNGKFRNSAAGWQVFEFRITSEVAADNYNVQVHMWSISILRIACAITARECNTFSLICLDNSLLSELMFCQSTF